MAEWKSFKIVITYTALGHKLRFFILNTGTNYAFPGNARQGSCNQPQRKFRFYEVFLKGLCVLCGKK